METEHWLSVPTFKMFYKILILNRFNSTNMATVRNLVRDCSRFTSCTV
jgi:hypothetical protein